MRGTISGSGIESLWRRTEASDGTGATGSRPQAMSVWWRQQVLRLNGTPQRAAANASVLGSDGCDHDGFGQWIECHAGNQGFWAGNKRNLMTRGSA